MSRMIFSCEQEKLAKGLGDVTHIVKENSPLPVTKNVMVNTDGTDLVLTTTNLEISKVARVSGNVTEHGSFLVSAQIFAGYVASLPKGVVTIGWEPEDETLYLTCDGTNGEFSGLTDESFPDRSPLDGVSVEMDGDVLGRAINRVVFAVSTEKARPILSGVEFSLSPGGDGEDEPGSFVMAAADGFRLAVAKGAVVGDTPDMPSMVIPASALAEVARHTKGNKVRMECSEAQVAFHMEGNAPVDVIVNTMSGEFPKWSALIPEPQMTRAMLKVADVKQIVATCGHIAATDTRIIRISVYEAEEANPGRIVFNAKAADIGNTTTHRSAVVEGPSNFIGLNAKYLADVFKAIADDDDFSLEISSYEAPCVIRLINSDYQHIIMPMHLEDMTLTPIATTEAGPNPDDDDLAPNDPDTGDPTDPTDPAEVPVEPEKELVAA